jgi:hypothetical protein
VQEFSEQQFDVGLDRGGREVGFWETGGIELCSGEKFALARRSITAAAAKTERKGHGGIFDFGFRIFDCGRRTADGGRRTDGGWRTKDYGSRTTDDGERTFD